MFGSCCSCKTVATQEGHNARVTLLAGHEQRRATITRPCLVHVRTRSINIYLRYGVSHFSDVVALYFVLGLVLISIKKNENSPDKKKARACVL